MGRLRNFSNSLKAAAFPTGSDSPSPAADQSREPLTGSPTTKQAPVITREASSTSTVALAATSATPTRRSESRPVSNFYDPPTMGQGREDQIEELRPVFSFLNSHQNKLYQEGYFLKLNDLDTYGKPNADRNWTECFAQLVGTVLSLWDAAALDAAGHDGDVSPTFINLADASIKMIQTLPTRNNSVQPLQNVLSVSTAGKNRYLLHFNSLHSLTQWTAGIRLSMFEHASLHELYTGSLIAGKGKSLNNIRQIMEKTKFRVEDWCRVRFGAGTPWRRCWFVIEPPDEKEWQRANKQLKKKGAYERVSLPRGDLKFYDTKKTKKATPIATISDVYAAHAVYPESKPLIEQSTLVKLEGRITIHSKPESETEGFVFVMPEVHPAVSGFEILLRFLFPIYDTFTLYGRPTRLIADTLDSRGLMFAMPKDRRYGYLDIIDVAGLIHTDGSAKWTEREWRQHTKDLVSRRMTGTQQSRNSESDSRRSLGSRPAIRFGESSPAAIEPPNQSTDAVFTIPKTNTAVLAAQSTPSIARHTRSVSETLSSMSPTKRRQPKGYIPSKLADASPANGSDIDVSPPPPMLTHRQAQRGSETMGQEVMRSNNSSDSDLQQPRLDPQDVTQHLPVTTPPTPVAQPTFNHQANDQPSRRPRDRPDLRRENSRMSSATLSQLVDVNKGANENRQAGAAAAAAWNQGGRQPEYGRGVNHLHHPEAMRPQANLVYEAINPGASLSPTTPTLPKGIPARRPLSEHSVLRKPLPPSSQPTTPVGSQQLDDPFTKMEDPQLLPVMGDMHLSAMLPDPATQRAGGVRKTVGDPRHTEAKRQSDVPAIDFGVTRNLNFTPSPPGSRPATGGRISPVFQGRTSPAWASQEEQRSSLAFTGPGSNQPRPTSLIWQPGSQPAGRQSPGALTPEEFVQQRASAARISSGYLTRRNQSPVPKEERILSPAATPSPPSKRLQKRNSSRPTSSDSHQAGSRLSARDQEHMARLTGGPLINLTEHHRTPNPSVGLVGAIEFREQERRYLREGLSEQLAQAETARRQQTLPQQRPPWQAMHRPQSYAGSHYTYQQPPQGYYPQQFPNAYSTQQQPQQGYYSQQFPDAYFTHQQGYGGQHQY